jgi:hypothetical protein
MGVHRLTSSVCALTGSSSARAASLSSAGWLRRLRAVGDHVRRGQEWPDAGAAGTPAEEQPDSRPPAGQAGFVAGAQARSQCAVSAPHGHRRDP